MILLNPIFSEGGEVGSGFLFPDGGKLGAGNHRLHSLEVIYALNYSYGITDSVEVEMGYFQFIIGTIGLRAHFFNHGGHSISLDTRFVLVPPFNDTDDVVCPGGGGILTYSFTAEKMRVSFNFGYGVVKGVNGILGADSIIEIKSGKKSFFIGEAGFLWSDDWMAIGAIMGPRLISGRWVVISDWHFLCSSKTQKLISASYYRL